MDLKFRFLTKISISRQTFRILNKISIFRQNFRFLDKAFPQSIFYSKIEVFCQKFRFSTQKIDIDQYIDYLLTKYRQFFFLEILEKQKYFEKTISKFRSYQ